MKLSMKKLESLILSYRIPELLEYFTSIEYRRNREVCFGTNRTMYDIFGKNSKQFQRVCEKTYQHHTKGIINI